MANFLAAIPWWVTTMLLLAGCVMLVYANRRAHLGLRSVGLVVVSLAALLGATRFLVDTDAEKCERRSRQLVDAVDKKDWPRLQNLLDTDTAVDFGSSAKWPNLKGAKDIRDFGERTAKDTKLQAASIYTLRTEQTPGLITVSFTGITENEDLGRPLPSDWEFDFNQVGKRWDLSQIKMLSLGNESTQ